MANIVTIGDDRLLVDVGFGSHGLLYPVPLVHNHTFKLIGKSEGRLEYRAIAAHTDPNQRVWVYSTRDKSVAGDDTPWNEHYALLESEYFPADYEVMNMATSMSPRSFFVQNVMCIRTVLDKMSDEIVSMIIMHQDYVKTRKADGSQEMEKMATEADRLRVLKDRYGIVLSTADQRAILGMPTELKVRAGHA
jgi:arylamine N-acetyltransferase